MRLLILTADYPPHAWSGIAAAVEAQARGLTQLGVDVHVIIGNQVGNQVGSAVTAAVSSRGGPHVYRLDQSFLPVNPQGFDRVHLHSLSLAGLAFELRRRYGLPVTYTAHSLLSRELDSGPESSVWIRLQRDVLRKSDGVVFLSQSERLAALPTLPELAMRAVVIGNALPPSPPAKRRKMRDGPIVFAGRFTANKGIELLSRLLPRLMRRRKLRAVLAGGHGDSRSASLLRSLRTALGDKCRMPGWLPRPSLRALLSGASLVLAPSVYEPFGLIALEAMRLGAPVLASRTGGLAEIVTPESGGCLASRSDLAEWDDRASEILDSADLWNTLHRRGPHYVARRFPMRGVAERLLQEAYV